MDNSQYHPPRTEHSAGIYGNIEKRVFEDSPERLKPPFQFVKDIEKLIDSFRDTAEAIEQANGREVKVRYLPVSLIRPARKREVIRRHLIDVERTLGGQLFAEKNKYYFWYGEKGESAISTPGVADWYIEEITPENPGSGEVTHIETHANYIKKFNHVGQRVPITLSDLEVFVPAAYHYVHTIMDAYPFEKDRADVLLDGLELPRDVSALLPPQHDEYRKSDYYRAA